ncbi:hypothetical protein EMIHUDRAFT_211922 [Emiliania huxleyi CCMP1516]|uniref:Uncharacterized protein n=2 Tax=Emiliania huxleyi TaxID=2903 RepID=A0A0D3IT68_EMIH1|nr:hypothetical protein EMIHUDRAFT_211922 [Emiliania huxleyi CCMP1516]EOD14453.1 hypothetical protein EMIHUDRAFT_211922 [Emiliania huxleyi CCMP1516]|eukprot:XP_005766882.1 hypothetical protein EMIHUDRAFT_211922 [Emiliania huxleyi CCMP1516]
MRVCGLPVLSAASLSETERGAGGADTADPSSTATAAEPMRVGSAASAAGAPAQTTPSDCKLGANLSGNALGEDVNEETTRGLQLDPATTARTANVGPAPPRGADISVLRHIDANNFHFNMLNEAGAAAAQTPNEGEASATELDASEEEEEEAVRRRLRVEGLSIGASGGQHANAILSHATYLLGIVHMQSRGGRPPPPRCTVQPAKCTVKENSTGVPAEQLLFARFHSDASAVLRLLLGV